MNDQIDSSIPVLTEVILPPGAESPAPKKAAAPTPAPQPSRTASTITLAPQALIRDNAEDIVSNDFISEQTEAQMPEVGSDDWVQIN